MYKVVAVSKKPQGVSQITNGGLSSWHESRHWRGDQFYQPYPALLSLLSYQRIKWNHILAHWTYLHWTFRLEALHCTWDQGALWAVKPCTREKWSEFAPGQSNVPGRRQRLHRFLSFLYISAYCLPILLVHISIYHVQKSYNLSIMNMWPLLGFCITLYSMLCHVF